MTHKLGNVEVDVSLRDPGDGGEPAKRQKYLVIDPCYLFADPQALWDEIGDAMYPSNGQKARGGNRGVVVMDVTTPTGTYSVFMWGTAYGDGCFPVFKDDELIGDSGVDSGWLCFCPAALVKEIDGDDGLGTYVDLLRNSTITNHSVGDIEVGDILVCTCGCTFDEDEDEDEDEG